MNIIDIDYHDLITDVKSVIHRVYNFTKVELDEASSQRMLESNDNNPKHKHGKFEYSIANYGRTDDEIARILKDYICFIDAGFRM